MTVNRIWNYFGAILLVGVCFFGAYIGFNNQSININDLTEINGIVVDCGTTNNSSKISGKYGVNTKVFFFKLNNSDVTFGVYRTTQKYNDLKREVIRNKNLTVLYKEDKTKDRINLQTYRLERNGELIMNSENYRNREGIAGWFGLIGGIIILGMSIRYDRKYWKKTTANTSEM